MVVWIDADAAPRDVKEIIFRAARKRGFDVMLVANQQLPVPPHSPMIQSVMVQHGANVADRHIVQHSQPGDLVITADIPLAAELVAKDVAVIDPRGEQYHADNIRSRLSVRDFMDDMRGAGRDLGGARPYGELDKKEFASTFDRLITRLLRA